MNGSGSESDWGFGARQRAEYDCTYTPMHAAPSALYSGEVLENRQRSSGAVSEWSRGVSHGVKSAFRYHNIETQARKEHSCARIRLNHH
jgi:hypothetical protein